MGNSEFSTSNDPFDLVRFVTAQERVYHQALSELRRGRKTSHWMWFIFPQVLGLGSSEMAKRYGLRSLEEAQQYLEHPVLGERLRECSDAMLSVEGKSASQILGSPDDMKLRSSMTLFSLVAEEHSVFGQVLVKYYDGRQDPRTLEVIRSG